MEKGKAAPPAGNLVSGSPIFQPLARISYHHHANTSHLNSLHISAADYSRSTKVMSYPQRKFS